MSDQEQGTQQAEGSRGGLSGAAELAIAALLLRQIPVRAKTAIRRERYKQPASDHEARQTRANLARAKKIWDDKYAPPPAAASSSRRVVDPDGNVVELPDWEDADGPDQGPRGIHVRLANNADPRERYRNFFRRTSSGPEVAVQARADPAVLAHEMGHAELYASGRQINGAASSLLGRLQEDMVDWLPNIRTLAIGDYARSWQDVLLPAAGAIAGLGAGALMGDNGSVVGGLVGGATALPLFAVEAEAWRRGAEYAKALGIGRRRYAAQSLFPLLAYGSVGLSNAALGAAAGELSNDLFRGELG